MENLFHKKSNEELTELFKLYKQFCKNHKYSDDELQKVRKIYPEFNEAGWSSVLVGDLTMEIADRWLEKFDFPEMEL